MQTALSERTWVQVNVDGPMEAREFRQLMRVLTAIGGMWAKEDGLCLEETREPESRVTAHCRLPAGHSGPHET